MCTPARISSPSEADRLGYRLDAPDRSCGTVEDREQSVSCRIHVPTGVPLLAPRDDVSVRPPSWSKRRLPVRRRCAVDPTMSRMNNTVARRRSASTVPGPSPMNAPISEDDGPDVAEPRGMPSSPGNSTSRAFVHPRRYVSSSFDRFGSASPTRCKINAGVRMIGKISPDVGLARDAHHRFGGRRTCARAACTRSSGPTRSGHRASTVPSSVRSSRPTRGFPIRVGCSRATPPSTLSSHAQG